MEDKGMVPGVVVTTYLTPWAPMDSGRTDSNAAPPAQDEMVPEN